MVSGVSLGSDPAAIIACTISRDVQNFDLLIEDMEAELGEKWGDLTFRDALSFYGQPEAAALEFVAIAIDAEDEGELALVGEIIRTSKDKKIKVILIAEDVGPAALHQLLQTGADDFCPYPLPDGALADAIKRIRSKADAPRTMMTEDGEVPIPATPGGNREGAVLAVHGMAGGVGSTTFAVNLAWELAVVTSETAK
jgi:pilus assembly protein CpaE